MLTIPKITDPELVFPANPPLPAQEDIPAEFWQPGNEWAKVATSLFFYGGDIHQDYGLRFRDGLSDIERYDAMRAVRACLGSFGVQHEHKEAGVAYMLSEWFCMTGSE